MVAMTYAILISQSQTITTEGNVEIIYDYVQLFK